MNLTTLLTMHFRRFSLVPLCLVMVSATIRAEEIYFQSITSHEVTYSLLASQTEATSPDSSVRFRSISGPGLSDAASSGRIRLVEASISPTTASAGGYPTFETDSLNSALTSLQGSGSIPARTQGAAEYRYGLGQGGENSPWTISFDGVPPTTPPIPSNFLREKIDDAIKAARLAIRVNPYRKGPGSGYALIFQAAYEATVPYTYAGNEWKAKADKDRVGVTPQNASITNRLSSLATGSQRYNQATEALLNILNHPVESAWLLEPSAYIGNAGPSWSTENRTWAGMLYQAYVEAVTQMAQVEYERLHTRYLKDYAMADLSPLIAEIHQSADSIESKMLPVSALQSANVLDEDLDTSAPVAWTSLLRRLADHVTERSLFFSPGINPLSGRIGYTSYGPNYVPFLVPAQLASRPFSFDNFLAFTFGIDSESVPPTDTTASANSLIGESKTSDTAAMSALEDQIQTITQVDNLRDETQSNYFSQMTQLCGQRRSDPANLSSSLIPDVLGYLLPTEEREPLLAGESFGDVALQWNKIEQAENRLLAAYRALEEIDEEADLVREYGAERQLSYDRIAKIQLSTGEQISALDYLSGEIRAKAIKQEAEQRAKQAEKKNWFSAIGKVVGKVGLALATGGTSAVADLAWATITTAVENPANTLGQVGGFLDGHNKAKSEAAMHRNIGRIQANAARRQAQIEAQQTRIRAVEGATITMEQAGQEENRIREAIHKLMIRVERQNLEILLAQQQLEFAELEHANMLGRISFLLEEYRRVSIRNAAGTLNRPDVRLRRDYQIQEALRKFRVAQEYAFICARAARYRFTGKPTDPFQAQIAAAESAILQAQNGEQLELAVSSLITTRGQFLNVTGGMTPLQEVRYSLRDLVAQSNHWLAAFYRLPNGSWGPDLVTTDLQGFPQSVAPSAIGTAALSDAQFVEFLRDRLEPDGSGSSVLRLRFPIGFEPSFSGRTNPLRTNTSGQYGHVIEGPGPSYASTAAVGVFVNIRNNRSINPIGLMPNTASMRPVGNFYTTSAPQGSPTTPIPVANYKVWNPVETQGTSALNNSVRILYNQDTISPAWASRFPELTLGSAGSQLHERSPANDHWLLEIVAEDGVWNIFLPNMRDIEICMTVRGWSN
jgi:hypothetical protein